MAGTSASQASQDSSSQASLTANSRVFHCPFRDYDGCRNGVNGRVYARTSLYKHLNDLHFRGESGKDICRERINTIRDVYFDWEHVLTQLQMWLCTKCMRLNSWKSPCCTHEVI